MRLGTVFVLAGALALGGCITGPSSERMAAAKSELSALKAERDAKRVTWTAWSRRTVETMRSLTPMTPDDDVVLAYHTLLASKVDRGEITPEMFELELAKATAALAQKDEQRRAAAADAMIAAGAALSAAAQPPAIVNQPSMFSPPITCTSRRVGYTVQTTC